MPTFEHVFRLDYTPYTRIDVHRVSGPISHMEGSWWLLPQPNGRILLVYELALDPGLPVPRFLVRATMKRDLPKIVAAVRERAEARPPSHHRARCGTVVGTAVATSPARGHHGKNAVAQGITQAAMVPL